MAAHSITQLKGVSQDIANKLRGQGLGTCETFLSAAGTPAGRRQLAEQTGMDHNIILELANRADLSRINGIGRVFSDLLEDLGVDTVKELAGRRPENLHAKMVEVNSTLKDSKRVPTAMQVEGWVSQAKALPTVLQY
jgi:predicted flap endonuclease-1-like 5' DNA nuclease